MRLWLARSRTGEMTAFEELGRLAEVASLRDQALVWWRRAADAGSTKGQIRLAMTIWDRDPVETRRLLTQASEAGDPAGRHHLVTLLIDRSFEEALNVLERSGMKGDLSALERQAELLNFHGRTAEQREVLERAAASGSTQAMLAIASQLDESGDTAAAERYLRRATRYGDAGAIPRLMTLFRNSGREGEVDDLLEEAMAAGNMLAIAQIGLSLERYSVGSGVPLLLRAATSGVIPAMRIIAQRAQKEGTIDEAELWWRTAVESGGKLCLGALADVVAQQGRAVEAATIRRFGLEPGGSSCDGWADLEARCAE
jgi:TPR repeat protein